VTKEPPFLRIRRDGSAPPRCRPSAASERKETTQSRVLGACDASNTQEQAPRPAPPKHSQDLRFSAVKRPQKRSPLSGIENGSSRPKPDSFAGRPARQASRPRTRNSNRRHPVVLQALKSGPSPKRANLRPQFPKRLRKHKLNPLKKKQQTEFCESANQRNKNVTFEALKTRSKNGSHLWDQRSLRSSF
jgi:hypothetical protein